jgi:hypothetical protein
MTPTIRSRITAPTAFDMLELTQTLEDRFGYHIPDDEVDQLRTMGDFIRWYEQHVAMEPAAR